ncbi:MAG: phage antirepressor KilAC domain-containing protein [Treponema sp.]|jgi:phage antirepressor YoqD-like protein|nr:phage antirepressor KilAC domain-containing protein [Treponema sp.]
MKVSGDVQCNLGKNSEVTLHGERRMTVQEVAVALGCNPETIKHHIRTLYPDLMANGKTTYLNETQATEIKNRIGSGRNDLQNVLQVKNTVVTALDIERMTLQVIEYHRTRIRELEAENREQQERLTIAEPKAEVYDGIVERGNGLCLRDTAGENGIRQTDFIEYLLRHKYLYRKGEEFRFYAEYRKYFVEREIACNGHDGLQVLVTPEGRGHFVRLFTQRRVENLLTIQKAVKQ